MYTSKNVTARRRASQTTAAAAAVIGPLEPPALCSRRSTTKCYFLVLNLRRATDCALNKLPVLCSFIYLHEPKTTHALASYDANVMSGQLNSVSVETFRYRDLSSTMSHFLVSTVVAASAIKMQVDIY